MRKHFLKLHLFSKNGDFWNKKNNFLPKEALGTGTQYLGFWGSGVQISESQKSGNISQLLPFRPKKQHLIPAYVLPNASEDLFLIKFDKIKFPLKF